jgi:hypothetical protein
MHIAEYYSCDIILEALWCRSTVCIFRVQRSFLFNSLLLINPLMRSTSGKNRIFNSVPLPLAWWTYVERIMYEVIFQFQTLVLLVPCMCISVADNVSF